MLSRRLLTPTRTAMTSPHTSEPLYHLDTLGQLTWTEAGLAYYSRRFARFGIRIEAITTEQELATAVHLSAAAFEDQLLAIAHQGKPSLERQALIAAVQGDTVDFERSLKRLDARNRLGLRVV